MSNVALLQTPHQLVMFGVGQTYYGIDIALVDEILPVLPITATPGAPAGVLGIVDVRKRIVPVFDLHVRFGVPAPATNSEARLILVSVGHESVALLVDSVEEVLTVSRDEFQSISTPGGRNDIGYLRGVLRRDDLLLLWVDPESLVPAQALALAA
ncbi:MAG: chemotaxis protein CheW [Dehalococcoidia bacterium]